MLQRHYGANVRITPILGALSHCWKCTDNAAGHHLSPDAHLRHVASHFRTIRNGSFFSICGHSAAVLAALTALF